MRTEPHQKMADYAQRLGSARLDRVAYQIGRASKSTDPDSVHDLRVAIRRFQSCLRLFLQFFPKSEVKKIRKRLREMLEWSAEVRDRDIAIELGTRSGLPASGLLLSTWSKQRNQAAQQLAAGLKEATKRNWSDKWRRRLNL